MAGNQTTSAYAWRGEGPAPPCWREPDGTVVFRDYESYVFDDDVPVPSPPAREATTNAE